MHRQSSLCLHVHATHYPLHAYNLGHRIHDKCAVQAVPGRAGARQSRLGVQGQQQQQPWAVAHSTSPALSNVATTPHTPSHVSIAPSVLWCCTSQALSCHTHPCRSRRVLFSCYACVLLHWLSKVLCHLNMHLQLWTSGINSPQPCLSFGNQASSLPCSSTGLPADRLPYYTGCCLCYMASLVPQIPCALHCLQSWLS